MKYLLLFLFSGIISHQSYCQGSDTNQVLLSDTLPRNQNQTYNDRIKTVQINALNSKYAEPIISIYPSSKIELTFDDLSDDYIEYHYKLEQCNKNWEVISNNIHDFYKQFSTPIIEDYTFSSATKVDYVHYRLELPGDQEKFLKSGNFLIHIFESETGKDVLTRRFMVVNPTVNVNAEVSRTDDVRYYNYRQQIKFEIYDPKSALQDIGHVFVRILKNASWDIFCEDIKPSFVNNDRITFERSDACTFDGGNEYRFFNMLEYRNISNNVARVNIQTGGAYQLFLEPDKSRSYLQYLSRADQNGKTLYTSPLKSFAQNELDYADVQFTLKPDNIMIDNEIYLFGQLSDFGLKEEFKMTYNADLEAYTLTKRLKQGLYDYEYVVKSIYQDVPDESLIEGSHFETENEYVILVYYTNVYEGFDELLGIERIKSSQKTDLLYKNK